MADEVFVDTSAWIAVGDVGDRLHAPAVQAYRGLFRRPFRLVTTNLVVAETYIGLRRNLGLPAALAFLDSLRASIRIEKVYSTPELERAAEEILGRYQDQRFSFTDAVSFAVMEARGIKEVFASDQHFRVAGFQLVP